MALGMPPGPDMAMPPGAPAPKVPPGQTGPATVAPVMDAKRLQGHIQVAMALNNLERTAALFGGSTSKEGQEILTAVLKLRKVFGGAEPDLQRQEVKSLAQQIPPVTTPTPGQGAAWEQAIKQRQSAEGLPAPAAA